MKSMQTLAVALLLAACSPDNSGTASAAGTNPAGSTLHVQRVEIMDRQGFEHPMPAATALIPVGWRAEGGIVWNSGGCVPRTTNWSATAPDGNHGIALLPRQLWKWDNFAPDADPCPRAQFATIRQYLENLVGRMHPGARVIDYRNREDLAQPFQHLNTVVPMGNGELRSWVEAGEILVAYTNQNGVDMRETVSAIGFFDLTRTATINGGVMESLVGQALNAYAAHAPSGQLDFRANEIFRQGIVPAPEWSARIASSEAAIANDTTHTYGRISAIIAQGSAQRLAQDAETSRYVSDLNRAGREFRAGINDELQRKEDDVLAGLQTYVDPTGSTGDVKLTYNYKSAWRLDDGTYILTDDLMFEPYKYTGQYGTQLKVKK